MMIKWLHNKYALKGLICLGTIWLTFITAGITYAAPIDIQARGGQHTRYNRIVFDWPIPVKYTMKQSGNNVTILFSKPAHINFNSIRLPYIRDITQVTTDQVTEVTFQVPDNSNVQAFWVGKKVAFDVLRLDNKPPVFSQRKVTEEDITRGPQKPKIIQKSYNPTQKKTATVAPPVPTATKSQIKSDEITNSTIPVVEESVIEPIIPEIGETLIRIRPAQKTNIAAFQRHGYLWLVFDKVLSSIPPQVTGTLEKEFANIKRITSKKATAYRFELPDGEMTVNVVQNNLNWDILVSQKPKTGNLIEFNPDFITTPGQPRLVAKIDDNPNIVTINDPDSGEQLIIATLSKGKAYTERTQRKPQFKILSSDVGVVIQPIGDGLIVNTLSDGVEIITADKQPFYLSGESDRISSVQQTMIQGADQKNRLFNFTAWQAGTRQNFNQNRQVLEKRMTQLTGEEKAAGYTDLAKLYLSHGFGAEARGLLEIAAQILPDLNKTPDFIALKGVAEALMGNSERAEENLNIADLKKQPEAYLWLGYARGQAKDWVGARDAFLKSSNLVDDYPQALKVSLILMAAEADAENGDLLNASKKIDSLSYDGLTTSAAKSTYRYLRGLIATKTDNRDIGIEELKKAAQGRDALYHAKAELDLVAIQLEDQKISLNEAINRLERLRFAWRGDRLEIKTMQQLGQYYIENQNYSAGLNVLKTAAGLAKNQTDIDEITKIMADVFIKLYVDGRADQLSPLKALALFNEFRELTPVGDAGNVAIENLAKRLVEVDLLDQAAELMTEQLRYRSSGDQAVEIGTRLAVVHLLQRRPNDALRALQESENSVIEPKLQTKRDLVKARALADIKKIDRALGLLENKNSDEAIGLKFDINWRAGRWTGALNALDILIKRAIDANDDKTKVSDLILKKAMALSLSGQNKALDSLRQNYGEYVVGTPQQTAFDIITQPSRGSALADLATLKAQVAQVELFQEFLESYR